MQRVHFQVWVGVFSCQQILTEISFVIFDIVVKKQIECRLAWHWWNSTDLGLCINWHAFLPLIAKIVAYYYSENRATSRIWKVLPNMVFPPIWGEKMAAFWACACKLSLTLLFALPGSAPIWGGKKSGTELQQPLTNVTNINLVPRVLSCPSPGTRAREREACSLVQLFKVRCQRQRGIFIFEILRQCEAVTTNFHSLLLYENHSCRAINVTTPPTASSETQGQLVGSIKCPWWKFTDWLHEEK